MPKLSRIDGLFTQGPSCALSRLQAVVQHVHAYLKHLANLGLHIIHSVPLFGNENKSELGLTSVAFQIVSKTDVTAENIHYNHEPPVILVLGMGDSLPAPQVRLEWNDGFSIGRRRVASYSTLCLPRATFLKACLLERLSVINKMTTLLPRRPGGDEKEDTISLTMYDKASRQKRGLCEWKLRDEQKNPGVLEYFHDSKPTRKYLADVQGGVDAQMTYSLMCEPLLNVPVWHAVSDHKKLLGLTQNQLFIPTTHRPGCLELIVHGESTIRLFREDDEAQWR